MKGGAIGTVLALLSSMAQALHPYPHLDSSASVRPARKVAAYKEPESTSRAFLYTTYVAVLLTYVATVAVAYVAR